jgi:hypothetical protein
VYGFVQAFRVGCRNIFDVEDDIVVARDFFTWCYATLAQGDWFAVDAARNSRTPAPDDGSSYYVTQAGGPKDPRCSGWKEGQLVDDLVSWGVCYPAATLAKLLEHVGHSYFSDMPGYCRRRFPGVLAGPQVYFSEQDGLIQRVMLQHKGQVAWSAPPRAWHVGWYGYHRNDGKRPQGGVERRYQELRAIVADPSLLAKGRGRYLDVEAPDFS